MLKDSDTDVIIIGGGPAGLATGFWCAELGLSPLVLEGSADFGGQLDQIFNPINNYLGIESISGAELKRSILRQCDRKGFIRRAEAVVSKVDPVGPTVELETGDVIRGRSIVIATGVRRRRLGVPGEDGLNGILESGAKQKESVKGRQVVIVGGGDAAFENALILADFASRIILVHRKESFRSRSDFVEQALKLPNIEVVTNALVDRIVGDRDVEAVEIRHLGTGRSEILRADNVLIRIGVSPNSEIVGGILDLDSHGYIRVDYSCETSTSGIYAVGDVANPISPTINSAAGMAATAAKSIESWLKAQKPL